MAPKCSIFNCPSETISTSFASFCAKRSAPGKFLGKEVAIFHFTNFLFKEADLDGLSGPSKAGQDGGSANYVGRVHKSVGVKIAPKAYVSDIDSDFISEMVVTLSNGVADNGSSISDSLSILQQGQNIIKAKHYGAKLKAVPGTLKEAITDAIKTWTTNPDFAYICGSVVSAHPFPKIVAFAQSIIGREIREQSLEQEGKLPDMIVGCVGGGSNFAGAIYDFLDEPSVSKIGVEAHETAALSNGTPGIMQGMKTYMLQTDDGAKSLGGMSLGAGITYFSVGPLHSYLKDQNAVTYSSATDQEMLEAYKIIARTEGICSALEPMAAAAEVIFRQAKNKPKDYTICLSLCGRGEKDLDTIQEHIGKDFE